MKTPKIFLDANILIAAGKPPGGPEVGRVADLAEAGLVTVLTTDVTINEVVKNHVESEFDAIKEICRPHFRRIVRGVTGASLPEMNRERLKKILSDNYSASTWAMMRTLGAQMLAVDDVKPSTVLDAYAAGEGFFTGEGKEDQFPDAFAFECLKQEASEQEPVIIVSQDADFAGPAENEKHISVVNSLPELFARLGLEIQSPEIEHFLKAHNNELIKAVDKELSDWSLQGDVEGAEIDESKVTEVEIEKLTAFKSPDEGDSILVVGQLAVKAIVSYTHPDWDQAIYDSEDEALVPFDHVSGETEVDLTIDVSMSITRDDKGKPFEIEELRFRNDEFNYVELHPFDAFE